MPDSRKPIPDDFTVEVWDGESEDANQFEGRVVDVVKIGDKLHLVVVADGI